MTCRPVVMAMASASGISFSVWAAPQESEKISVFFSSSKPIISLKWPPRVWDKRNGSGTMPSCTDQNTGMPAMI